MFLFRDFSVRIQFLCVYPLHYFLFLLEVVFLWNYGTK